MSGILYLSQNFICFAAATFGFKVKEVIPIRRIVEVILEKKKKKAIHIRTSDRLLVFCQFKSTSEAFGIINGVWSSKTSQQLPTASSDPDVSVGISSQRHPNAVTDPFHPRCALRKKFFEENEKKNRYSEAH